MTTVKAKLTVTLKADEVLVAEIEDAALWQSVLNAIHSGNTTVTLGGAVPEKHGGLAGRTNGGTGLEANEPLDRLAQEVGLDPPVVEGACAPTSTAPYMQLNKHNWEALRKQLPQRGPLAISPIVLASTLLALWFSTAGLGNPTQAQVLAVLKGIGVEDHNPSRGIRRATWLIPRGNGQVQLNAAEVSTAVRITKAFCSKDWEEWMENGE
jgi:hypothetical protein